MTTYFNEFDAFPVAWLRGLWPEAATDDRSITDVEPADLVGHTQCHFFAGAGGWQIALDLAGWPADLPVWTGSCPCQPFSVAGKGLGESDARHLWPEWFRLIRSCRPGIVVGEQVSSKAALGWIDGVFADMEGEGYTCRAYDLPAAGVGAPHIRQRLYWVAYTQRSGGGRGVSGPGEGGGSRCGGAHAGVAGPSSDGRLADTQRRATERHGHAVGGAAGGVQGETLEWERVRVDTRDGLSDGRLADAARERRQPIADVAGSSATGTGSPELGQQPRDQCCGGCADASVRLGDATVLLTEQFEGAGAGPDGADSGGAPGEPSGSGTPGWRDARAIWCRDGKWRRVQTQSDLRSVDARLPVGTRASWDALTQAQQEACLEAMSGYPLARGIPNRVGMLHVYGNAIVPQLAAAFISAVMEELGVEPCR